MYFYDSSDDGKSKIVGAIAAAVYIALWFALMLLAKYTFVVEDSGEGILISFGDTDEAAGMGERDGGVSVAQWESLQQLEEGDYLTQDFEEAPIITTDENREPKETREESQESSQEVQERVADPRLSFPGVATGGEGGSTGTSDRGSGVQGSPDGSSLGSPSGTGFGSDGVGFDLAGRRVVGKLPLPSYDVNDEGTVVIEVVVSPDGTVKSARRVANNRDPKNPNKRTHTTTLNDSRLINEAISTARRSRFDNISGDTDQIGWLIYRFNLR